MSFCSLTLSYFFFVSWVFDPVPNFTKQNPLVIIARIILEIDLFTTLNSFADAVKTQNLREFHLYLS